MNMFAFACHVPAHICFYSPCSTSPHVSSPHGFRIRAVQFRTRVCSHVSISHACQIHGPVISLQFQSCLSIPFNMRFSRCNSRRETLQKISVLSDATNNTNLFSDERWHACSPPLSVSRTGRTTWPNRRDTFCPREKLAASTHNRTGQSWHQLRDSQANHRPGVSFHRVPYLARMFGQSRGTAGKAENTWNSETRKRGLIATETNGFEFQLALACLGLALVAWKKRRREAGMSHEKTTSHQHQAAEIHSTLTFSRAFAGAGEVRWKQPSSPCAVLMLRSLWN